jgi:hypothetical protein
MEVHGMAREDASRGLMHLKKYLHLCVLLFNKKNPHAAPTGRKKAQPGHCGQAWPWGCENYCPAYRVFDTVPV